MDPMSIEPPLSPEMREALQRLFASPRDAAVAMGLLGTSHLTSGPVRAYADAVAQAQRDVVDALAVSRSVMIVDEDAFANPNRKVLDRINAEIGRRFGD